MRIADRFRKLTQKAEETAAEHKDQLHQAVQKAEDAADRKTGGEYHDQFEKAAAKADGLIDGLQPAPTAPGTSNSPVR